MTKISKTACNDADGEQEEHLERPYPRDNGRALGQMSGVVCLE